ncbi:hypothetical protein V1512DRAFT_261752 [Lipomyces arxii]|uniref:uncharacterized protein n=1 Tax=Lipomyces arxii TaxID=56418 RepID=UPI0034CFE614
MALLPQYFHSELSNIPASHKSTPSILSNPRVLVVLTLLICLSILFSNPHGTTGLWLYKISTDCLGSALPTLTPRSPASAGLPDAYYVGLWTYCAVSQGKIECPSRSVLHPFFFFNLPMTMLNSLVASSTTNSDLETNIFLPNDVYVNPGPRKILLISAPQLFFYISSLCYLAASIASCAMFLAFTRLRMNAISVRRSMLIVTWSMHVGAAAVTVAVWLLTFRLNTEITLAYRAASINTFALFVLWSAAMLVSTCKTSILSSIHDFIELEEDKKLNAKIEAAEANRRVNSQSALSSASSATMLGSHFPMSRSSTPRLVSSWERQTDAGFSLGSGSNGLMSLFNASPEFP